jgi:hypothetical protein
MLAIEDFLHIKDVKFSSVLYANTMLPYKDC